MGGGGIGAEWLRLIFDKLFNIVDFLRERRRLKNDPMLILSETAGPCSPPLGFALKSMVLPGAVTGAVLTIVNLIHPIPKAAPEPYFTSWKAEQDYVASFKDRMVQPVIADPQDTEHDFMTNKDVPYPDYIRTQSTALLLEENLSVEAELVNFYRPKGSCSVLSSEKCTNLHKMWERRHAQILNELIARANGNIDPWAALAESSDKRAFATAEWRQLIARTYDLFVTPLLGLALVLNAYVFTWLLRRLTPAPGHIEALTRVHLYSLGISLFYPSIGFALLATVMTIFDTNINEYFMMDRMSNPPYLILVLLWLWYLMALVAAGRRISVVVDGNHAIYNRITHHLFLAQGLVGFVMWLIYYPTRIWEFPFLSKG